MTKSEQQTPWCVDFNAKPMTEYELKDSYADLAGAIERYNNPELYRKSNPETGEYWDEEQQDNDLVVLADAYFDARAANSELGKQIARLTEEMIGKQRIREAHGRVIKGVLADHDKQFEAITKERDDWKEKYLQAMEEHGFTREFLTTKD